MSDAPQQNDVDIHLFVNSEGRLGVESNLSPQEVVFWCMATVDEIMDAIKDKNNPNDIPA